MAESRARRFIDALHHLEDSRNPDTLVGMFADGAELNNPTAETPLAGGGGAREFWQVYRDTFGEIHSDFHHVLEKDDAAMLEWTSRGSAAHGGTIEYDGVTVLEFDGDKVKRFRAYFDPHALGEQLEEGAR